MYTCLHKFIAQHAVFRVPVLNDPTNAMVIRVSCGIPIIKFSFYANKHITKTFLYVLATITMDLQFNGFIQAFLKNSVELSGTSDKCCNKLHFQLQIYLCNINFEKKTENVLILAKRDCAFKQAYICSLVTTVTNCINEIF